MTTRRMMNYLSNAIALLLLQLLPTAAYASVAAAASEDEASLLVKNNRRHLRSDASSLLSWLSSSIATQSATTDATTEPLCMCSPLSYTFTINLSQNCDTDTFVDNPGMEILYV